MNPFHDYLDRMLKGVRSSEEAKRDDELLDHLQQLRADYAAQGLADEHAVRLAVADFGDSGRLGGLLNTAMSPYRKWLRASTRVALSVYALKVIQLLFLNWSRFSMRRTSFEMPGYYPHANLTPFVSIRNYAMNYSHYNFDIWFFNLFGNVLLFVPLGFLLPILFRKARRLSAMLSLSLACSLAIELTQLATRLGQFDVDDLLLNALGGLIGFAAWFAASRSARWIANKYRPAAT